MKIKGSSDVARFSTTGTAKVLPLPIIAPVLLQRGDLLVNLRGNFPLPSPNWDFLPKLKKDRRFLRYLPNLLLQFVHSLVLYSFSHTRSYSGYLPESTLRN